MIQSYNGVENNSLKEILQLGSNNDNNVDVIQHSQYYDDDSFFNLLKSKKSTFSVVSMNIESINAKFNELQAFIHMCNESNFELSAICIQESWLSENDDYAQVQLDNYTCIVRGKKCSNKGGLIIYLHNKFNHTVLPTTFTSADFEGQFIQVKGGGLKKPITIGNIYRPPRDLLENYTTFINEMTPILCDFEKQNTEVLISGDFNIDLLKVNRRQIFNDFLDCLITNSFFSKITLPTRLSSTSATLIDNFFCKLTHNTLQCTSGILMKKLSDHQPYLRNTKITWEKHGPLSMIFLVEKIVANLCLTISLMAMKSSRKRKLLQIILILILLILVQIWHVK